MRSGECDTARKSVKIASTLCKSPNPTSGDGAGIIYPAGSVWQAQTPTVRDCLYRWERCLRHSICPKLHCYRTPFPSPHTLGGGVHSIRPHPLPIGHSPTPAKIPRHLYCERPSSPHVRREAPRIGPTQTSHQTLRPLHRRRFRRPPHQFRRIPHPPRPLRLR